MKKIIPIIVLLLLVAGCMAQCGDAIDQNFKIGKYEEVGK